MKYKNFNYFEISHITFDFLIKLKISHTAKLLFVVLCKLEHRFTGNKTDFFYRSIKELKNDSGLSEKTIVEAIKILKNKGLIETWQMHWEDKETNKKSEKHITAFRILDEKFESLSKKVQSIL